MRAVGRVAATVALLLTMLVGGLVGGARAGAQEYGAVCSVAAAYDEEAGTLRVVGTGLEPGFTTPIVLDGETIGEATADGDGNFEVEITIALDDVEIAAADDIATAAVYVVSILCNEGGDQSSTTVTTSALGRVVHVVEPATVDCAGNLRGFALVSRPGTEVSFTLDHTGEVLAVVPADANGRAAVGVVRPHEGLVQLRDYRGGATACRSNRPGQGD